MAAMFGQPRHTARGIVVHDGQILLMERWRGDLHYFSIPGGGVELGESAEQAVVREIEEETTLLVEVVAQALEMHDADRVHKIYICKYLTGEPNLPAEAPEALHMNPNNRFKPVWMPVDQVKELPFDYWKPVQEPLINLLKNGFKGHITVVSTD